jgi:hypothetical protein
MPVEIKELHIKAVVQDGEKKNNLQNPSGSPQQINHIVAECVEQVLKIIREKEER